MDDASLRLDHAAARRLLLVQAIDEADTQGKLLGGVERQQLEQEALQASRATAGGPRLDAARFLQERAQRVLAAVENRDARLAALQEGEPWRAWLAWCLPLAACLLAAAFDRIDNPRQVNMLSPPLLAVLLWNLLVYLGLLLAPLVPRPWRAHGPLAALQRQLARTPTAPAAGGSLRRQVLLRFQRHWLAVAGLQQAAWWRQVLHATAAGWAVGLAISIVLGGLVREYRVGWESTLLDLPQVHAFLRLLFVPVVLLLPFEPFSMAELQRMHFGSGAQIGVEEARRWVWLYLALLFLLVVVPRLALAMAAAWRVHVLGRAVRVDLRQAYFADLLARVSPARVLLCLLARDARSHGVLLRVLRQAADQPALQASAPRADWTVLVTQREDELRVLELPAAPQVPRSQPEPAAGTGWLREQLARWKPPSAAAQDPLQVAREQGDLLVLLPASVEDVEELAPLVRWLGKPALLLVDDAGGESYRAALRRAGLDAKLALLGPSTRNWWHDRALRDAIADVLPAGKAAGFVRIAAAWEERNQARLEQAMRLLAGQLLQAARDSEDVPLAPVSLKQLVKASEREAGQQARQAAMQALAQRVRESDVRTLEQLLRLYGIEEPVGAVLQQRLDAGFIVQQAVDSPQASMAGAATGAAMGAGIDLMTGGLTLGAAAALGALVGGAAAYTAAHWRNRATPSGGAQVQLGDAMLQDFAEAALLRYLAVVHWGRDLRVEAIAPVPAWQSEVVAAVEAERAQFAALWSAARGATGDTHGLLMQAARLLQEVAQRVLARL